MTLFIAPEREVLDFVLKAEPGATLVYAKAVSIGGLSRPQIDRIRSAYNDGLVDLCQRRGDEGFAYIAQMRRHPAKIADHGRFQGVK